MLRECFHEGELFHGRKSGHVHPGGRAPFPEVVSVGLDGPEGDSSQPVDFEDQLSARFVGHDEDVRLFAHADLVADGVDGVM